MVAAITALCNNRSLCSCCQAEVHYICSSFNPTVHHNILVVLIISVLPKLCLTSITQTGVYVALESIEFIYVLLYSEI